MMEARISYRNEWEENEDCHAADRIVLFNRLAGRGTHYNCILHIIVGILVLASQLKSGHWHNANNKTAHYNRASNKYDGINKNGMNDGTKRIFSVMTMTECCTKSYTTTLSPKLRLGIGIWNDVVEVELVFGTGAAATATAAGQCNVMQWLCDLSASRLRCLPEEDPLGPDRSLWLRDSNPYYHSNSIQVPIRFTEVFLHSYICPIKVLYCLVQWKLLYEWIWMRTWVMLMLKAGRIGNWNRCQEKLLLGLRLTGQFQDCPFDI